MKCHEAKQQATGTRRAKDASQRPQGSADHKPQASIGQRPQSKLQSTKIKFKSRATSHMHPSGKRRRSKTKGHRTQSSVGHRTCINKQRPQLQATGTRRAKDTSQAPKATGPMAKATGHWSLLIACRRLLGGEGHKSKSKSHTDHNA